ncbi:GlxA family transcriptional regulator [Acinetobacter larvae]|uniref:HTH araC/xylS-type domain-containing protein n=1 Tax=Acinetobacter larvae TaxID=1789224 RepID=A0A1B2LWT4_9GAMM|nr:helix-turn-helix domain-containing protein [Acinetobacter larvae]AOA57349.1 hypothetical protein BFG52_02565 [Acinetobacter larvae]
MNHQIVVVAFEDISPFHLSIPSIIFMHPILQSQPKHYELKICSQYKGLIETNAGFAIHIDHDYQILAHADTIIIPAWSNQNIHPSPALIDQLQQAKQKGNRIIGLCLGTLVLAKAGLLEHCKATTHWAYLDQLQRDFPNILLQTDCLYIQEQNIITSAGTAAAMDCCLHIVALDHGLEIANQIAQHLVIGPHRMGMQSQKVPKPLSKQKNIDQISRTMQWMLSNLNQPQSLEQLANYAHMSIRSFTRNFQKRTGCTVHQWLLQQRIQHARYLLETQKHWPIDYIAEQSGFSSTINFRQQFSRYMGLAPSLYRKQFHPESSTQE